MKKGSSYPSPLARTRHIESVEVGFPGPSAVVEFSHSLFSRVFGATNPHNRFSGFSGEMDTLRQFAKAVETAADFTPDQHPAEAGC